MLKSILSHPLTRNLNLDDPQTTIKRKQIIQEKAFLKLLYLEWYEKILNNLENTETILEIGSGASFITDHHPNIITSELFTLPNIKIVTDACALPFNNSSLDAIIMTDVFHHIPDAKLFLTEATRCLKPSGKIVMIEPWRTKWSEWVFKNLHHEPFDTSSDWNIPASGPLSGANGALPWIVFERDNSYFKQQYPYLKLLRIEQIMPISYLISGGISMRSLCPGWMYYPIRKIERLFEQKTSSMFALIELERI